MAEVTMDKLVSLCKRRGFIFQGSEIYGGLRGAWDYGPLGVELKNNIKRAWWKAVVQERDDMVGLDAAILMHPRVWEASGHVERFTDPMVDCKSCKLRWRADDVDLAVQRGHVSLRFDDTQVFVKSQGLESVLVLGPMRIDHEATLNLGNAGLQLNSGIQRGNLAVNRIPVWVANGTSWHFVGPGDPLLSGSNHYVAFDISGHELDQKGKVVLDWGGQHQVYLYVDWAQKEIKVATCPDCGGELTEARMFNLMFKTYVGPVEEEAALVYLRPETAQGIFVNFLNVQASARKKLPFGIAQIGKAFRNEITPKLFTYRTREFEQMEIEYFVRPPEGEQWHKYWLQERLNWYINLGIRPDHIRLRHYEPEELAHYAAACADVECLAPWGWMEVEGIANRTDYDLSRHSQYSGEALTYFDPDVSGASGGGEHITPYVIEPSAGVDRIALAFLLDAYEEETVPSTSSGRGGETRVILRLHKDLAPIKVAVLPLSRNEQLIPTAREVYGLVRKHFMSQYDDAQSIGRRYRRQDEIGTPYCVTIDFQTLEDRAVTIRDRDTMEQIRVPIPELVGVLREKLGE